MKERVGVVGLGKMGSGLAKNLRKAGFEVAGYDRLDAPMKELARIGGIPSASPAEAGTGATAAFVMVLNGGQANSVIFGEDGLANTMAPGSTIILTATITAREARQIWQRLEPSGIHLLDAPVSGGFPGAQAGTLTMMIAGPDSVLDGNRRVLEAVSSTIHHVGHEPGMGQTVKGCLQSLIGAIFTATFEATVLAAKSGVDADAFFNVVSTSSGGSGAANTAIKNIIDGTFTDTGSHISTMYKDMTIAMDLAREQGVPLFTAAAAMQLFQAGITKHPEGDNWVVTRVIEDIAGAKLRKKEAEA